MTARNDLESAALRGAVTFYASFDTAPKGDFGGGDLRLWTRADDPAEKGKKVHRLGFDESRHAIVRDGVSAGALAFRALSADNAFLYFPAQGKFTPRPGGWGGAVSLWVKADLDRIPEKGPWDPFLLVEKGWNNGAVWNDFAPGAAPRDFRVGLFPALPAGMPLPTLEEGEAIWLRVPAPRFRANTWHHIVQVWDNFDTGQPNAWTACYLDGELLGRIEGRNGTMNWDLAQTRLHVGSGLVGAIDEVAIFNRPLTDDEIHRLQRAPDLLSHMR